MITKDTSYRTSAQIALEDKIFHELFGMVWKNGGYIIKSSQDLSWAIFYKDMFLQGLSDYVNKGFIKLQKSHEYLVHDSAEEWMEKPSPFNDPTAIEWAKKALSKMVKEFYESSPNAKKLELFNRKFAKAIKRLDDKDPFSFDRCCDVLGLNVEIARARFKLYRKLKEIHGDGIRIVTYTGNKKNLNIPDIQDIIDAEADKGEHDLTLFLHIGVKRDLRNRALVRSKNERSDKRDPR